MVSKHKLKAGASKGKVGIIGAELAMNVF